MESCCNICPVQVALPSQPPWWELFDVRLEDICEVACEMQALYGRPKAQYINVREEVQVRILQHVICMPVPAAWVASSVIHDLQCNTLRRQALE